MNTGMPPTPLKERTGELTPPGITLFAAENNASAVLVMIYWLT
jgi:hypothetical protein